VTHPSGLARENKARSRITRWLASLIAVAGGRLFGAGDAAAVQHGWQITVRRGGLGRGYRDPRFDALRACPRCHGSGRADHEPCTACDGTGRVTVAPSRPATPEGQCR
jgi:hypothetical protein